MYRFLTLALILVLFASCRFIGKGKTDADFDYHQEMLEEMLETDRAFSLACKTNGMKKSFLEFVADDAVLLRPNQMPIVEGDVIQFLSSQEDTSFTMTWKPMGARLAASNDLGYTYGVYEVVTKDTTLNGTYLSIWRKQKDGKWKFELDTGNPGLGESNLKTDFPETGSAEKE